MDVHVAPEYTARLSIKVADDDLKPVHESEQARIKEDRQEQLKKPEMSNEISVRVERGDGIER